MKMIAHHFPDTLLDALRQLSGADEQPSQLAGSLKKDA